MHGFVNAIVSLDKALNCPSFDGPKAIIMDTIKGKGVVELENNPGNHSLALPAEIWRSYIE